MLDLVVLDCPYACYQLAAGTFEVQQHLDNLTSRHTALLCRAVTP